MTNSTANEIRRWAGAMFKPGHDVSGAEQRLLREIGYGVAQLLEAQDREAKARGSAILDNSHPEARCEKCGGPNVTWFAPSELWNKYARTEERDPMLCPVCFIILAEAAGCNLGAWSVTPENVGEHAAYKEDVK